MTSAREGERGGILALSALVIPVFLLSTALVLDVGNWYTHKRALQNRADAGALAAGVEYLSQLNACSLGSTGATATAISDVAKSYAGTGDAGRSTTRRSTSTANSPCGSTPSSPTASDCSDGGNPCEEQLTRGDSFSPSNAIWTDVKAHETNLGTLFGGFGLTCPPSAQARVEVKQLIGIAAGGPPVHRGDR